MWYRSIFNDSSNQNDLQKESKIKIDLDNDTIQGEQSEPEELIFEKNAFVDNNEKKCNDDISNAFTCPNTDGELTEEHLRYLQEKFKFRKKKHLHDIEELKKELSKLGISHLYNEALNKLKEIGRHFNEEKRKKKK